MKEYHECAIVKDGNKRVGYFIQNTKGKESMSAIMTEPWELVDKDTFESLVKDNKIQFLVYENRTVKCRYTDEEKDSLLKLCGVKEKFIEDTERNYFDLDIIFSAEAINLVHSNYPIVAGSAGEVTSILGQKIVLLYLYGTSENITKLYNDICAVGGEGFKKLMVCNNTVMCFTAPVKMVESIFNICSIKPVINTATLRHIIETKVKTPKLAIEKAPKEEFMKETVELIDRITKKTLLMYNK